MVAWLLDGWVFTQQSRNRLLARRATTKRFPRDDDVEAFFNPGTEVRMRVFEAVRAQGFVCVRGDEELGWGELDSHPDG